MEWKNRLYFGDNLDILRRQVPDSSVDLIYLDPPFNSSASYNVLFKEKSGEESAAQITAFEDAWQWSMGAEAIYKEIAGWRRAKPCVLRSRSEQRPQSSALRQPAFDRHPHRPLFRAGGLPLYRPCTR